MIGQTVHPLLPRPDHDELARQNFVKSFKLHIATKIVPGIKVVYERRVRPAFEKANGHPPSDRRDILDAMSGDAYYGLWGSLFRTSQEMSWDSVLPSVDRQQEQLVQTPDDAGDAIGSLELNRKLEIPRYLEAVDFHAMPGGYHREFGDDDVSQGALYDRGAYLYSMGAWGPMLDAMGQRMVSYIQEAYPNFAPASILDMGCSIGHSTLPYADAFPNAEIFAIDVAAPLLRYGHARAEYFGKKVAFSQQNCEATNFPDSSFDFIVSHILVHEMPAKAIDATLKECHRLLRPGGMTLHVDLSFYQDLDPFDEAMLDWDTYFNNEPFWNVVRQLKPAGMMSAAGFAEDQVIERLVSRVSNASPVFVEGRNSGGRSNWFIFGARKEAA
jgi:ubiquinone/menaquinone biosynthesis C-methylase UbiE